MYRSFLLSNPDSKTVLSKLSEFAAGAGRTAGDIKSIKDFESVYIASGDFWPNVSGTANKCNPRNQVRFADAYGGIMGGVLESSFPGFGTIIGGAIGSQGMSAFIEHLQGNNGGGCI